jgi:hypothetical protein
MSVSYGGDSIVFADGSVNSSGYIGNRNRIINGAMVIDQRNAGASITPTDGSFMVDRFRFGISQTSKFTSQQNSGSVTPPAGFTNYLGLISSSAYTPVTGDYFFIGQRIEGYNVADLAWGTAAAVPVTLSFWVRSSLTGSFGGSLQAGKSYTFSYTINVANTWEYKSITISGDTSTAMPSVTTGKGIELIICLGSGSGQQTAVGSWTAGGFVSPPSTVNVCATSGATFYITGVQLERGSTASSFEYRSYTTEQSLCYRYCIAYGGSSTVEDLQGLGNCNNSTTAMFVTPFPVRMRAIPSVTTSAVSNFIVLDTLYTNYTVTGFSLDRCSPQIGSLSATINTAARQGTVRLVANSTTSALVVFSAEL